MLAGGGGAAFALGWLLSCAAAWRARSSARTGMAALALGAIFAAVPPMVGAWIHVCAGLAFATGGVLLARDFQRGPRVRD